MAAASWISQYAQMFNEGKFPVDLCLIEKDHDFLDHDSLRSLFRKISAAVHVLRSNDERPLCNFEDSKDFLRLETLNKHAGLSLDSFTGKKDTTEDDEEYQCALSERWEYNKSTRRWYRKNAASSSSLITGMGYDRTDVSENSSSLLHKNIHMKDNHSAEYKLLNKFDTHLHDGVSPRIFSEQTAVNKNTTNSQVLEYTSIPAHKSYVHKEKNKSTQKIDTKTKGSKFKKSRGWSKRRKNIEISGPIVDDSEYMREKLERLNCKDILPKSKSILSPPVSNANTLDRHFYIDCEGYQTYKNSSTNKTWKSCQISPTSPRSISDVVPRKNGTSTSIPPAIPPTNLLPMRHESIQTSLSNSLQPDHISNVYSNCPTLSNNGRSSQKKQIDGDQKKYNDTNSVMKILMTSSENDQTEQFSVTFHNGYPGKDKHNAGFIGGSECVRFLDTNLQPDMQSNSMLSYVSTSRGLEHRLSMYDNMLSSDNNVLNENEPRMIFPGIYELPDCQSRTEIKNDCMASVTNNAKVSSEDISCKYISLINSENDKQDTENISIDESAVTRAVKTFQNSKRSSSVLDRTVSFETISSETPRETIILGNEADLSISVSSRSSRRSSSHASPAQSRVLVPSSSVDSYFLERSSQDVSPVSRNKENMFTETLQNDYDDFDIIMQRLHQDIDDLTHHMERETSEVSRSVPGSNPMISRSPQGSNSVISKSPQGSNPTVSRSPAGSNTAVSRSPHSSNKVISSSPHDSSPVVSGSPHESNNSSRFYRLPPDQNGETSFSGGDGSSMAESTREDYEFVLCDVINENALDEISELSRESRGHSLDRTIGEQLGKKIRWHSLQKSHIADINSGDVQMNCLSVSQIVRLQKLSLLKLTGIMEKCLPISRSGWNWIMPRFRKRQKTLDFCDKKVFGVPLSTMAQRTGQPLPQCILYAMRYLRRTCPNAVGIFRKSGVKSKIQQLKNELETNPDTADFEGTNTYNVADVLKMYLRDLPECLLTNKMSDIFRSICMHVPKSQRLEAIQTAIVLLPDENREVLQSILLFLNDISSHEADHQMSASNLAVCFTPAVFKLDPEHITQNSPRSSLKNCPAISDPRDIMEQKAAHDCLLLMITESKKLFTVIHSLYQQLEGQSMSQCKPVPLQVLSSSSFDVRAFGQERIQMVLKEAHEKNRGWIQILTDGAVEVFYRKLLDDCLLKEWKLTVEIEAPPVEVLYRIMNERHVWDEDLLNWSVIERPDPHSDIFQYVVNSMVPHPCRHFCVLRYWRSDLNNGACALITMSTECTNVVEVQGVWAEDLGSYFLIEPLGHRRSKVTYITRMDTRGRTPEWYRMIFGHICVNFLDRLKQSFRQASSEQETNV